MEKVSNGLETVILERLKKAGRAGITNAELAKTTLRYGAVLFTLREKGYSIITEEVKGAKRRKTFRYTLLSKTPGKPIDSKKGYDVLLEKLNDLGGFLTLADVEEVIEQNNLVVTHRANGRTGQ